MSNDTLTGGAGERDNNSTLASQTDNSSYPTKPSLVFENGKIKQLDFWIQPQKRVVWWNLPGWKVKFSMRKAASSTVPTRHKRAQALA